MQDTNNMQYIFAKPVDWNIKNLLFSAFAAAKAEQRMENEIRRMYGIQQIKSASLGRTALKAGLNALPFAENSRILIPDIVCPTVIYTILKAGYRPLLCDVEDDLHISVRTISGICRHQDIRMILVPHLYGLNAPIDEIRKYCRDAGIFLIDDAAQAVGLKYRGQYLGTYGDMGLLSFGPYKNIGISRGGFLFWNDQNLFLHTKHAELKTESFPDVWKRLLSCLLKLHYGRPFFLSFQEMKKKKTDKHCDQKRLPPAIPEEEDYKLSAPEANLIRCALKQMDSIFTKRLQTARDLIKKLKQLEGIECLASEKIPHVKIPIRLSCGISAASAVDFLRSLKIEAERIYCPLHLREGFGHYAAAALPQSEKLWEQVILIPNPVRSGRPGISGIRKAFEQMLKKAGRI